MGELVAEVFDKAKVWSPGHMVSHRLRATFAVDLLQKGVPLEHESKLLGHKSVTTTERHYAKWVKGLAVVIGLASECHMEEVATLSRHRFLRVPQIES